MAYNLTLIQLNDVHAYLDLHPELFWQGGQTVYRPAGGYARIATLVNQIRAETGGRVLFCDGGDTFHGTYPAAKTQGQALVPILNALGLDAMTAHWDFGYGPAVLRERVAELHYPLLACNVYDAASGARWFPPFLVNKVDGIRVGVIGVASNIVDKTMPPAFSTGLRFTLGREELPPLIAHLRAEQHVDLVVLLSHLGFPQDMQLLSEVAGIDVCLSSHTHNRLAAPVHQGQALVIQSGCHGSFVGRLDLNVAGERIVDYRHQLLTVREEIVPDPAIASLVRDALAPDGEELATVVGETAIALDRGTALEATMDTFLLHALRAAAGTQLAFSNGWRYGAPILPGPIVLNDLYNITPMNPPITTVELTGAELVTMLEENLERTYAADPYQQMGGYVKRCLGLHAYVKIENPAGCRIQALFVDAEPVDPDKTYTAAYITVQGVDGMYGRNRRELAVRGVAAMRAYLRQHGPVRLVSMDTFLAV